jgi:hypothetical protein
MPFAIHIDKPTRRAIAHLVACPEVPADPVVHANDYWLRFPTQDEAETALETLGKNGFRARWCECPDCRQVGR